MSQTTVAAEIPKLKEAKKEDRSFAGLVLSPKVLIDSIVRLSPVSLLANPVMLIV
jgi:hypothetical protein